MSFHTSFFVVLSLMASSLFLPYGCHSLQLGNLFPGQSKKDIAKKAKNLKAAVIVPGFLTGAGEFQGLCDTLTNECGLPTVAVPMPNWHWIPCLGGRSARPILERIDYIVQHLVANHGDIDAMAKSIPPYRYSLRDLYVDFQTNPGGIKEVGGSSSVDDYPIDVQPQGTFPLPSLDDDEDDDNVDAVSKKVALIGHSAGGWISRAYLSSRSYGGKAYNGSRYIHSLVTLGTPHQSAPGPAFEGVQWVNREPAPPAGVRSLAVGGTGFKGDEWGALTKGSYSFCCDTGTDGTSYTGDGVTPIQSALGFEGAEQLTLDGVTHFCWKDVFGADFVAPELTEDHRQGRPWYGSEGVVEQWADWIKQGCT